MPERLANLLLRRRRRVLLLAVAFALIGAALSGSLFDKMKGGGFDNPGAESGVAAAQLRENFGQGQSNLVLLVEAQGSVDAPDTAAKGKALADRLAGEPQVKAVTSYWTAGRPAQLRSTGGDKALVLATVTGDETEVDRRLDTLVPDFEGERDGLQVRIGGFAMLNHEMVKQSTHDATIGEALAFPVALIALVLVFGSLIAAALPLVVALLTLMTTLGVMWVLASATDLSVVAVNVVTLLGLGLAIDYSLLIVNRFREELGAGHEVGHALRITMGSAGRTVAFSSVTVAIAVSAMLWFPLLALRSMAYAGVVVALLSAVCSLTVLPALLAISGRRVLGRRAQARPEGTKPVSAGFWHRTALFVMRRPLPVATVVTAILLLLGTPFLGMKLSTPDERSMPESASSRQVTESIKANFSSAEQNALSVVMPNASGDLGRFAAELSRLENVGRVDGPTGSYSAGSPVGAGGPAYERFRAGEAVYLSVVPSTEDEEQLDTLVQDVRAVDAPAEITVGGVAAVGHDTTATLIDRLPIAASVLAVAIIVLLFLLTGSVFVPLLAVLLSILSLSATFGALVWIFQDGHLSGLLGFTVTGSLTSTVPVMLFCVAFGLAMDYQVFLLSRIKEEHDHGGDPTASVAVGLEKVGRIVTAAAVLISLVFLGFLVSDITYMKAFGIGLPLAVLVDATLIRGALLPAAMRLGGRATWWAPRPLRRLHERFGMHEGGSPSAPTAPTEDLEPAGRL